MSAPPGLPPRAGSVAWLRVRKRGLDRIALWSLLAVFAAVLVPWLFRAGELRLSDPARAALAYLVAYQLLAVASDRLRSRRALRAAMAVLQGSLLGFLAALWGWLGGLGSPALLAGFGVPVGALGALLGRGAALAGAGLSVASVTAVALGQSGGLRWYFTRARLPAGETLGALGALVSPAEAPGRPAEQFAALSAFAVLLVAWALVSAQGAALARRVARSEERVGAEGEDLGLAALAQVREPEAIVEAETGVVAAVSRGFVEQMLLHGETVAGRELLELIGFDDAPAIRGLLSVGGRIEFCAYRIGPEPRIARLDAHRVEHRGVGYTWLRFVERTELWWLRAGLDASSTAVIVVGADGRLRYASAAAQELLGALHHGLEADEALEPAGLGNGGWRQPRETERRVELRERLFLARSTPLQLATPRGSEPVWLVTLRPRGVETA